MFRHLGRTCGQITVTPLLRSRLFSTVSILAKENPSLAPIIDAFKKADVVAAVEKGEVSLEDLQSLSLIEPKLKNAIAKLDFKLLTPVQSRSILPILMEDGVVCRAKTGTGKTMAFAFPILQTCLEYSAVRRDTRESHVQALVVAPTRDLALQIADEFAKVTDKNKLLAKKATVHLAVGGKREPFMKFAPSVVVATPGRLEANLRNPKFAAMMSQLKYKVYDEADRLLDQGFEETLHSIDEMLEDARNRYSPDSSIKTKNVLFSATIDERMEDFASETIGENYTYINCVNADEPEAHENIHQTIVKTKDVFESHVAAISDIFRKREEDPSYKAILFVPTVSGSNFLYDVVDELNRTFPKFKRRWLYKLNGGMSQGSRDRTTENFRKCLTGLLICTDVAARGLDFKNVSDVIQITPSNQIADYVHKVGRTARAGTSGNATLYLTDAEGRYKKALENNRGIVFSKEIRYETFNEDSKMFEELELPLEDAEDYAKSLLGFYQSVLGTYRLNLEIIVRDLVNMHRSFISDSTATLFISGHLFNTMKVLSSLVPEYIKTNVNVQANRNFKGNQSRFGRSGGLNSRNFTRRDLNDRKRFSNYDDGFQSRGRNFSREDFYGNDDRRSQNDRKSKRSFDNSGRGRKERY